MSGAFRLGQGGRVDRAKPIPFTFDGKSYVGCAGDTLASALIANGVHLIARSFKYHRPRGILSLGSDDAKPDRDGGCRCNYGRYARSRHSLGFLLRTRDARRAADRESEKAGVESRVQQAPLRPGRSASH